MEDIKTMKKIFIALVSLVVAVSFATWLAHAATYDDYVSTGANSALSQSAYDPGTGSKVMFLQSRHFDLDAATLNSGSGVTGGDVIQLFEVPPNTYIIGAGVRVTRASGTNTSGTTATIGDGTDPDGYVKLGNFGVNFDATNASGASVWTHQGFETGVTPSYGDMTTASNTGSFFSGGLSPYIGPDTIDMTIYVDKVHTASGVTPAFDAWVWGFHVPGY